VGGAKGCRGLSELGRRQVEALRDRWLEIGMTADVVVTSTLPRAIETAAILAAGLGGLGIMQLETLCEIVPGECDGMTWDEFEVRFRGPDYVWDPHTPVGPGGESWVEFQARVSDAIARIAEEHAGRTVVAAVHGGVIDGSMVHFLGLPRDAGHVLQTENASVTEWVHVAEGRGIGPGGWRLVRFNDHAHLERLA